jgi:mannose-P-dolichol utilization defect protein 1
VDHNLFDVACLRLLVSKVLSIGIILGAVLVKVPQIVNIVRARSTKGLAASMYALENLGYLITVVYNTRNAYAFSTYGENLFLLAQGLLLVTLFGLYNRRLSLSVLALVFYAALGYYLYFLAPLSALPYVQSCTIPVFAASRLPQIARNFSAKSTGVLSLVTVLLNALGALARVFTTLSEVDDSLVLTGMLASASMNVVLLAQVFLYWNNTAAEKKAASSGHGKTQDTVSSAKKKSSKSKKEE